MVVEGSEEGLRLPLAAPPSATCSTVKSCLFSPSVWPPLADDLDREREETEKEGGEREAGNEKDKRSWFLKCIFVGAFMISTFSCFSLRAIFSTHLYW